MKNNKTFQKANVKTHAMRQIRAVGQQLQSRKMWKNSHMKQQPEKLEKFNKYVYYSVYKMVKRAC